MKTRTNRILLLCFLSRATYVKELARMDVSVITVCLSIHRLQVRIRACEVGRETPLGVEARAAAQSEPPGSGVCPQVVYTCRQDVLPGRLLRQWLSSPTD